MSIHSRYIQIIQVIMNLSRVRVEYLRIANHKHIAVSHYQKLKFIPFLFALANQIWKCWYWKFIIEVQISYRHCSPEPYV